MGNIILILIIFSLLGGSILRIVCLINRDIKVIIAYSSVVHIALIIVNILSKNFWRLNGAIIIIVAHGICSSGIFSCANIIYERSHSRIIIINKSNLNYFPIISIFSFFSAAYRLVLYSNLQQGLNNNLFFNINNLSTRERITLFSHS